jgi:hypothetical protein
MKVFVRDERTLWTCKLSCLADLAGKGHLVSHAYPEDTIMLLSITPSLKDK